MTEVNFLVKKGLTVPKGSASTPAVIFDASDPNTGLYSPGADQVAVATNGTGRLFIDASGNVGVGTASPGTALHLGNSSTLRINNPDGTRTLDLFNDANNAEIKSTVDPIRINAFHSTGYVRFDTNNQERARIDSSGRLLVGTSDGSGGVSKLVVQGASNGSAVGVAQISYNGLASAVLGAGTDIGYLRFTDQGSNSGVFAQITATADATTGAGDYPSRLVFSTTADGASTPTERMRISSEGSVLVGTTTDSGSVSNTTPVVAGRFYSFNGSSSAASGSAITMFTAPNTNATYMVVARLASVQDAANYEAVTLLSANGGASVSLVATPLKTGGLLTISLSGADVQATQGAGGPATISWVVTRIG
jgi:hypothetical protein